MPTKEPKPQRRRVEKLRRALVAASYLDYGRTAKWAKDDAMRDLLSDVRHYCDAHGIDFAQADRTAYDHYLAERHPFKIKGAKS
jgi:hypothetical protein